MITTWCQLRYTQSVVSSLREKPWTYGTSARIRQLWRLISLPNVGRVDHAFAFHISNLKLTDDLDVVHVFMKDTHMTNHRPDFDMRSLGETVHDATGPAGYACGRLPGVRIELPMRRFGMRWWMSTIFNVGFHDAWSFWHDSHSIKQFRLRHPGERWNARMIPAPRFPRASN